MSKSNRFKSSKNSSKTPSTNSSSNTATEVLGERVAALVRAHVDVEISAATEKLAAALKQAKASAASRLRDANVLRQQVEKLSKDLQEANLELDALRKTVAETPASLLGPVK